MLCDDLFSVMLEYLDVKWKMHLLRVNRDWRDSVFRLCDEIMVGPDVTRFPNVRTLHWDGRRKEPVTSPVSTLIIHHFQDVPKIIHPLETLAILDACLTSYNLMCIPPVNRLVLRGVCMDSIGLMLLKKVKFLDLTGTKINPVHLLFLRDVEELITDVYSRDFHFVQHLPRLRKLTLTNRNIRSLDSLVAPGLEELVHASLSSTFPGCPRLRSVRYLPKKKQPQHRNGRGSGTVC